MRKTRFIALYALFLLLLAQSSVAFAEQKINPTGRDITLTSLLRISDSVIGETDITITAEDDILLPKLATLDVLKTLVDEDVLDALSADAEGENLSQVNFERVGLGLTFEFSTLECVISIPNDKMLTQQLSMGRVSAYTDYISPSLFSGFLNVTLSNSLNQSVDDDTDQQHNQNHRFESALNYRRLSLEYESTYDDIDGLGTHYLREGTRLNLDFPDAGSRLVLGDMFNNGTLFQSSADIAGIGLTRDFSLISTKNVRPTAAQSFTLTRTSSVDVVIDGAIVQRFTLNAGTYNLNDIPIAQGLNNISLIITDASGQKEEINFSVATGSELLNTGEFEYSLMLGAPRVFDSDRLRYDTDKRLIMGNVEFGAAPWLTVGVNGQQLDDVYQYGGNVLFATSLGVTELHASQSEHPSFGSGNAFRFAFDADIPDSHTWLNQFSILYDQLSPNFAGTDDVDTVRDASTNQEPLNSVQHFWSVFAAFQLSSVYRGSFSATFSKGHRDNDNYWSASPSVSGPIFDTDATWSTRVDYQRFDNGDDEFSGTLTLSWPLGRKTRVVSRFQSENRYAGLDVSYQDAVGNTGGISAFASVETQESTDANLNASIDYTGNRYQASIDHATRYSDINQDVRTHNTRVEISSAIAFSGTTFAIGREIGEAFAVVSKHSTLSENRVAVDPAEDEKFARVFLEGNSHVLVSDLAAYSDQIISYHVDNLPPGYDLGEGGFALYPGYRQGYALNIGSDAVITAMGTLINRRTASPIALVAGIAYYLDDENIAPLDFFTNRQGRFAISGLRPGNYKLVLKTNAEQTLTLSIDSVDDTFVRLGELYVD
ncbi:fimbria/pilus outer membrane usher protein [Enterovibrio norvegicus]|uniref:fimbria/pilus outer membrane usher protein n=1 Tax=Enterovibrio norvegicus TaxID=188144 RepID=UPI000C829CBC|nr:fimbria/pilus outer membrane usher protein [Enterovibrio norvegicus]PML80004.1 fimbrial protein [Enterovibrio norvegicus]